MLGGDVKELWKALSKMPSPKKRSPYKVVQRQTAKHVTPEYLKKLNANLRRLGRNTPPHLTEQQRRNAAHLRKLYPNKTIRYTNTGRPYVRH
jgi:hypothetical protein